MESKKWNKVLIEWVNCLKLCKNTQNISDLRNGEFFSNLQKVIHKSSSSKVSQDVLTFIFDLLDKHYPHYIVENKTEIHLCDLSEVDLRAITSLLMHYTCIYDRKDVLLSPLCHSLSQETQFIIRSFLQRMNANISSKTIDSIITQCLEEAADIQSNHWLAQSNAPQNSCNNSPLQDLLKTPISKFGRLQEKDKLIASLRSDLELERYEKSELQEQLQAFSDKIKKSEQLISQRNAEISRLRCEVAALESRTPPHYQDQDSREMQRRLREEIHSLELYIHQNEEEHEATRKERDRVKEQLRNVETQSAIWQEKFFAMELNFDELNDYSKKQQEEIVNLKSHCDELSALLEEYRNKTPNDSSMMCDSFAPLSDRGKEFNDDSKSGDDLADLACSVVEVQLRDAQKIIEEMKLQLEAAAAYKLQVDQKLEDNKIEIELYIATINKHEQDLIILKEEKCKFEDLCKQLSEKCVVYTHEKTELTEEISKAKLNIEKLHHQINTLETVKENSEKQLQESENKIKENKLEIEEYIATINKLDQELIILNKENHKNAEKCEIYEKEKIYLNEELIKATLNQENLQQQIKALETVNEDIKKQLLNSQEEIKENTQQIETFISIISTLDQELIITKEQNIKFDDLCKKLKEKCEMYENEKTELIAEIAKAKLNMEKLLNQINTLETVQENSEKQLQDSENTIKQNKLEIEEYIAKISRLDQELIILNEENYKNAEKCGIYEKEKEMLKEELNKTMGNRKNLQLQINTLESINGDIKMQLKESKEKIKENELQIETCITTIDKLNQELMILKEENMKFVELCKELSDKCEIYENEKAELKGELANATLNRDKLLQQINSLKTDNEDITKQLYESEVKFKENQIQMSKELNVKCEVFEKEKANLNEEFIKATQSQENLKQQIKTLETNNEDIKKQLQDSQKKIKENKQQIETFISTISNLDQELIISKKENIKIDELCKELKEKCEIYENEKSELKEQINKTTLKSKELLEQINSLESVIEDSKAEITQLSSENRQLEFNIKNLECENVKLLANLDDLQQSVSQNITEYTNREEKLKQQIVDKDNQRVEELKQILSLLRENSDFVIELNDVEGVFGYISRTVEDLNAVKQQLSERQNNCENIQKEKSRLKAENVDLLQKIESVQAAYSVIQKEKELAEFALHENEKQLEIILQENRNLTLKSEDDTLQINLTKQQAANTESLYKELNDKYEAYEKEKTHLKLEITESMQKHNESLVIIKQYEEKIEIMKEECEAMKQNLQQYELKYEKLTSDNNKLDMRVKDLESSLEKLQSENSDLKDKVQSKIQESELAAATLTVFQGRFEQIALLLKQHNMLPIKDDTADIDFETLSKYLAQGLIENSVVRQKLIESEANLAIIERHKCEAENSIKLLENKLEDKNEELNKCLEERAKLLEKIDEYETKRCEELSNAADQDKLKTIISELNQEKVTILEQLHKLEDEKQIVNKKLEIHELISIESQDKIKSLEDSLQDYEMTISGLKKVIDENLDNLSALREENKQLHERHNALKLQLDEISTILQDENSDIDMSSSDIGAALQRILAERKVNNCKLAAFETMCEKLQVALGCGESFDFNDIESSVDKVCRNIDNALKLKDKMSADLNIKRKENILGPSSKTNLTNTNDLKRENMQLKKKLVLIENSKNNIERVLKELREEKKKSVKSAAPSLVDDQNYKMLLDEHISAKEEYKKQLKEADVKYQVLKTQYDEILKQKQEEQEDKKLTQDLRNIREAYGNVLSANSKLELENISLRKIIEERGELGHIKEAYEKLLEENNKLMTETDTIKYKRMRDKEEFVRLLKREREEAAQKENKKIQEIRNEYEAKLEKMKNKMLQLYRDEVNKEAQKLKAGQHENTTLMKTISELKSELFESEQKRQLLEMERDMLKAKQNAENDARYSISRDSIFSQISRESLAPNQTYSKVTTITRNIPKNEESTRRASTLPRTVMEEVTISRRTSIGVPNDIGRNLHMEDEEDLFNDKYLADMKDGRCSLAINDKDPNTRYSELAWRNSLMPPHLKSSYPAEIQFVSPNRFKDEDIKAGHIEFEDSLCKLLPGEKPRKKDFGTTSYKKPGPPTPSKNGGRLSLQGNEIHPMKDFGDGKTPKKSTPSRIKALFTSRTNTTKDNSEGQSTTPSRAKRLNIFRRPR